jgi:hypothetical protein
MPDQPFEIPVTGERIVAVDGNLHDQNMSQLAQIGVVAQQNFVTYQKLVDADYLEAKHMVSLTESLGAREVGSRVTPAGPAPATKTSV